jgi:hypothetical protein
VALIRARHNPTEEVDPGPTTGDLYARIVALGRFVNASAGQLPVEAVVIGRRITDQLTDILANSAGRPLDPYAMRSVEATIDDYLPTTLKVFLALDSDVRETVMTSGRTPAESLLDQLRSLESATHSLLDATKKQEVDALAGQESFLRTKFTQSDLDL